MYLLHHVSTYVPIRDDYGRDRLKGLHDRNSKNGDIFGIESTEIIEKQLILGLRIVT